MTVKRRKFELALEAISAAGSKLADRGHSMLDCPEQIQTSPTTTSLSTTVLWPRTWRLRPSAVAFRALSRTDHRPFWATVETL